MDDRTGDWVSVSELEGAYVHRVMLQASGDFVLDVSREKPMSGEIRLEQAFRLRDRDGVTTDHDPRHPAQLGPALELAGQTVVSVSYSKRGELDVELADGLHLFASSHPDYENWHIAGGGVLIISRPGIGEEPADFGSSSAAPRA